MKRKLFSVGAVIALTIALFQGPQVDSAEQVAARSVKGAKCSFSGYTTISCTINSDCTGGTTKASVYVGGSNASHQKAAGGYRNGNCTGNAQCPANGLLTDKLTTNGCGGGG
ncbi:hypothetical protein Pan241w_35020 [Gimesia alba]|uniref:Uncharacterized protein n=1 Tax=Gimesia alba TaxID=2527973 RepID=A0A517RHS2_9PLAN|nr:hypothetical protein [Gimesia alba]QDT43402.1 hypothetical protein Pan241w_35020 [Gimesia alba]